MIVPEPPNHSADYVMLEIEHHALSDWNALTVWRGSIAHGTYVPPEDPMSIDDKDLIGICIPSPDYYVGLREFGSRGTEEIISDPWDIVVYEHRKALRLLAKGNPNMLCMLWAPPALITYASAAGEALLAQKHLFATKAVFPAYRGYAQAQLKKMQANVYQGYMGVKRRALVDQFGYDTKNASHAIRIMRQGIDFLLTGEMEVYRSDAEELLAIKRGEFSLAEVKMMASDLDTKLARVGAISTLPQAADRDAINALAVEMYHYQRDEA